MNVFTPVRRILGLLAILAGLLAGSLTVPGAVSAVTSATGPALAARSADPLSDPFYDYDGKRPLAQIKPGTVLKTRTVPVHVAGVPLLLQTVQLLYRSTGQTGRPTVNVTSVVRPLVQVGPVKAVAYGSAYDSLNPADQPSAVLAGSTSPGASAVYGETLALAPLLLAGYTVVIADTQGQEAAFGAGPLYGINTLDSLRAATQSPAAGLTTSTKIGLFGYSGGAIATEWAAELAPSYAPEIAKQIVGSAMGGVLVHPARNLDYIDGSRVWAGVLPMALIGLSRAYDVDLTPYLNRYGRELLDKLEDDSILNVLGRYPGLAWDDLAKPEYPAPESVPELADIANELIMSTGGTPSSPLFVVQGTGGYLEGTPGNKPGIGPGDGVMVAGDVRSLAREYCDRAVKVEYRQNGLSHVSAAAVWVPQALLWLQQRFAGLPAPSDCGSIPPGNPLTPVTAAPSAS
ncbi:lipase family protein [Amycolatopsis palatopharyngis]|uniref:lipase family protein n=1 Tax=Amycolatopsis palatopharyngis TaxID=187982 RepID=UPI000E27363B|nr:lipase family protein [Amycolatopsis palatopharyngis]